jgi:anion-transporting  ArsA/GET3 family ATPase
VLCVEVDGKGDLARCLGAASATFQPKVVQPNVSVLALDPEESLQEYLRLYFKVPRFTRLTPLSKVFEFIATGLPGTSDMLVIGKIAYEAKRVKDGRPVWDLIIVDSAATGHVLPQLGAARAMMDLARGGIVRSQVEWIDAILSDPRRSLLTVCALPEEMPVAEALELHDRAKAETTIALGACFLNRVFTTAVTSRQLHLLEELCSEPHLEAARERLGGDPRPVLAGDRIAQRLHDTGAAHARRLRAGMTVPVMEIPLQTAARPGLSTTRAVAAALRAAAS